MTRGSPDASRSRQSGSPSSRDTDSLIDANGGSRAYGTTESADISGREDITPPNIYLWLPNLIGYVRVALAIVSLYFMPWHPHYATTLYTTSCLLDAVDGLAARAFDQSTKFGAVLDMVTDRCTTTCLLCYLAGAYPNWAIAFQLLISLDISSHYMHMYSTLSQGSASHKALPSTANPLLRLYYSSRAMLFWTCFGNEACFVVLYMLRYEKVEWIATAATVVLYISLPICILKQILNLLQLGGACSSLVKIDQADWIDKQRRRRAEGKEGVAGGASGSGTGRGKGRR
ncbi:hypothetical protein M427DRAFT_63500 [Gonapodya prolifera JEL478]|uniref:CDP-diacylglycerol--inositol 3-phosphatidyltransferase n=1 Tax=Gonapodya prolifera (strain JEL478) TaxID=1344416 RepID=A0A138ZZ33_GONPJ|nr:hypothetical protein M427DRAFT_63500 [Gonapodya prolifera JEL478]|eukprot:KXS09766.1 hypothetical protein M427DRAFT_63500 [Gonapodya prolifera JEL478]